MKAENVIVCVTAELSWHTEYSWSGSAIVWRAKDVTVTTDAMAAVIVDWSEHGWKKIENSLFGLQFISACHRLWTCEFYIY